MQTIRFDYFEFSNQLGLVQFLSRTEPCPKKTYIGTKEIINK